MSDSDKARPVVAGTGPIGVELEEGETYYFCASGRSRSQPFCDGTHARFAADDVGKPEPGRTADASKPPEPVPTAEEPHVAFIHQLAREGLSKLGHHGPMTAMGVPREQLPR